MVLLRRKKNYIENLAITFDRQGDPQRDQLIRIGNFREKNLNLSLVLTKVATFLFDLNEMIETEWRWSIFVQRPIEQQNCCMRDSLIRQAQLLMRNRRLQITIRRGFRLLSIQNAQDSVSFLLTIPIHRWHPVSSCVSVSVCAYTQIPNCATKTFISVEM